jgi:hypothetical protein
MIAMSWAICNQTHFIYVIQQEFAEMACVQTFAKTNPGSGRYGMF